MTFSAKRRRSLRVLWMAALLAGCDASPRGTETSFGEGSAGHGPVEATAMQDAVDLAEVTDFASLPISPEDRMDLTAPGHDLVEEEGEPDFANAIEIRSVIDDEAIILHEC
jgi:hypothetical protein